MLIQHRALKLCDHFKYIILFFLRTEKVHTLECSSPTVNEHILLHISYSEKVRLAQCFTPLLI